MTSGFAGNRTRAVARTPPPDSTLTSKTSGSEAARAPQGHKAAHNHPARTSSGRMGILAGELSDDRIQQPLMDLPHPFKLSFRRKPLVKSVGSKLFGKRRPGLHNLGKRLMTPLLIPVADQ